MPMSPHKVAVVRWPVLFLRKLDCNCHATRGVFPQVRVSEPEAGVMQKITKCVKMCLAILVEGHNKRLR
jgi:hypothetical protein